VFVLHEIEVCRWYGLAMPGHIEGDHPKVGRDVGVAQLMAILASVSARGMQTDQRNALAMFLVVGAIALALALDIDIPADDWIIPAHVTCASSRPMALP